MSDWTAADLDRIGSATELEITTRRADGSLRPYDPMQPGRRPVCLVRRGLARHGTVAVTVIQSARTWH